MRLEEDLRPASVLKSLKPQDSSLGVGVAREGSLVGVHALACLGGRLETGGRRLEDDENQIGRARLRPSRLRIGRRATRWLTAAQARLDDVNTPATRVFVLKPKASGLKPLALGEAPAGGNILSLET